MANPFYNATQGRMRAGWRIVLHMLMFLVLTFIAGILVSLVAMLFSLGSVDFSSGNTQELTAQLTRAVSASWVTVLIQPFFSAGAGILALFLAGRWFDKRKLADFGFHFNGKWWVDFAFGCSLGAVLMLLIFLVELAAGWVTISETFSQGPGTLLPFGVLILGAFLNYIAVAINEESLSRGYQTRNMAEGFRFGKISPRTALLIGYLISSSIFGCLHLMNPNTSWMSTVNLIVAGLLLGAGYVLTGELAIPIGIHLTWNFFQGNVFGFPVSGTSHAATFIAIQQGGPTVWTGGDFGPEAGIIGLLAMVLGIGLIYLWVRWREGSAALQGRLSVFTPQPQPAAASAAGAGVAAVNPLEVRPELQAPEPHPDSNQSA
jgi:membrane protease YdiL (CAAX protease family)